MKPIGMPHAGDIRERFQNLVKRARKVDSPCETAEILGATFIADQDTLFGVRDKNWIKREITWYDSRSLNIDDLGGKVPELWRKAAGVRGNIVSNYGWMIYSEENGDQLRNVVQTLSRDSDSRRACAILMRPSMHEDAFKNGADDFCCTWGCTFRIIHGRLVLLVNMRSNDAVFGYRNDLAWWQTVQARVLALLRRCHSDLEPGEIIWSADSLHVYRRHWEAIAEGRI